MLSDNAYLALSQLDDGATFNTAHTIARELIDYGLAREDWGRLAITDAGRRVARGSAAKHRFEIISEHVCDLSAHVSIEPIEPEPTAQNCAVVQEAPPDIDSHTRGLRAAGVATGRTGIEVDAAWVIAFIDAWASQE